MAKEEQGNAMPRRRHSIGAIGEGWARKRTAPRRTGNGPIRSGVEQPSWDRLRMATAQTRYTTSGDGKVTHCSVMAKQSRGMQRRWTDTGSEGVALRSRAWRRQSEAWQGEGMARQRFDRRRLWNAMQHNGTSWLSGAREELSSPRRWRRGESRGDQTLRICCALPCNGNATRRLDAQRSSRAANGGGVARQSKSTRSGGDEIGTAPHGYLRGRAPGAWTRACRMAEGPGLRQGRRAVTFSEPPA